MEERFTVFKDNFTSDRPTTWIIYDEKRENGLNFFAEMYRKREACLVAKLLNENWQAKTKRKRV